MEVNLSELETFIVLAKSQTWSYLDSYFGGTDFIGQEVVWESSIPVWVMNYYGRILLPQQINAERAGKVIKESLSELYKDGRFLGGFRKEIGNARYVDTSEGNVSGFFGTEKIIIDDLTAYRLDYHGGLVKP